MLLLLVQGLYFENHRSNTRPVLGKGGGEDQLFLKSILTLKGERGLKSERLTACATLSRLFLCQKAETHHFMDAKPKATQLF